ncbi:MAG: hypothetical protein R2699_08345 [Acidimicrobiales bacterium]
MVANRSGTTSTLNARAWSIITPLARPWCMSTAVPRAWAQLCTRPRPFWKAIAPIIDDSNMAPRASRSVGSATARARLAAPRRRPSRAMPSQIG